MSDLNLMKTNMREIVEKLESGAITNKHLVTQYLDRIGRYNDEGPELHAVIATAPKETLLATAAELDRERSWKKRSTLHGIPVLIKDTLAVTPELGFHTTGGTRALEGCTHAKNAEVVNRLLQGGAIVLGSTNMTIMNNNYGKDIPTGWSIRGGQTQSAFGKKAGDCIAWGSSSGSAVAVSAGLAGWAIGGETCGSLVAPAISAGIFALKPSLGLIPTEGAMPVTENLDCIGPMARSAWDIAAAMDVLDPAGPGYIQYAENVKPLSDFKFGIVRQGTKPPQTTERAAEEDSLFMQAATNLQPAIELDPADVPGLHESRSGILAARRQNVMIVDMHDGLNIYLSGLQGSSIKKLDDLVDWNNKHPTDAFYDPDKLESRQWWLDQCLAQGGKRNSQYFDDLKYMRTTGDKITKFMDDHHLDALAFAGSSASVLAATTGFPMITLPYKHLENGEPCGVTLMARMGSEPLLISAASSWEDHVAKPPIASRLDSL